MQNENAQTLAEKIASLLQAETPKNADFHLLQSSLERINRRLDCIETRLDYQNPKSQIPNPKSSHSSQEKFTGLDELADQVINNSQTEKACPYEPTGKPCDQCAMCSSRGF